MRIDSGNLFSLVTLGLLAGLSFWLASIVEVSLIPEDKQRHDPDIYATDFNVDRYDAEGALRYRLTAPKMRHYPDDDSSEIDDPFLENFRADAPKVEMRAKLAVVTENGKHVEMKDDVRLVREAYGTSPELVATTSALTVLPDEGRAFNDMPVRITQGASWLTGVGIAVNDKTKQFALSSTHQSRVRGEYSKPRK
ncbi:MAG: LPS export ABC transporter periplasmic protein LptC [Zoogloeaceae bacterium]|jgi:lipopolysaccharide export system protein LptC|nr:LPS export ABC transporter periplasmic protein LptC [Zoogloeaceae bacterium]